MIIELAKYICAIPFICDIFVVFFFVCFNCENSESRKIYYKKSEFLKNNRKCKYLHNKRIESLVSLSEIYFLTYQKLLYLGSFQKK